MTGLLHVEGSHAKDYLCNKTPYLDSHITTSSTATLLQTGSEMGLGAKR